LMRKPRHLATDEKDSFGIFTPDAITGMRDRIFGPIFIAGIAVPSISLIVGGIVIMNIMLVSVTERRKEIGVRKAVGARRRDIHWQFLAEAMSLSATGGLVGVFLAWLAGRALTAAFFPTRLSITTVIIAVAVSSLVGALSGILPAWKAARLDPITVLRSP